MTTMTSGPPRQADPEPSRRGGDVSRRMFRGHAGDPAWARPALLGLLAATALLYVWGLGASGWANSFYSAAVQAGTRSWKAFFFGSSDASNFITVDKTPMALWPMELSARVFGLNAWSILVPQALMGVATVGVVYATVRRCLGGRGDRAAIAGALLAGAVLATTPVAALMFRFNNPDALLVLLVAGLWLTRGREHRNTFTGFALWGGWLLVTGLVFSFMQGIFHGYYTIALAPAVAAPTGMGAAVLWRERRRPAASVTLAATVALTAWWSYVLLGRTPDFLPWLRMLVLIGGLLAAALLASAGRGPRRLIGTALAVAALTSIAGPAAYAVETAGTPHTGAIPTAGPSSGPGGMPRAGAMRGRFGGPMGGGRGGFPGGPRIGNGGMPQPPGGGLWRPGASGGPGGPGGLLNATTPSAALTAALKQNACSYTWVAATVGSNNAAGYQLATGEPVMALGGFNGTDPTPSLQRFQEYVRAGRIHYFIGGSTMMMARGASSGGSDMAQQIAAWVQQNFTAKTIGGATVYDLSPQATGTA